jgi:hypothetical protein
VDEDLDAMTCEQLIAEVRKLRAGVRAHRYRESLDAQLPHAPRSDAPYRPS